MKQPISILRIGSFLLACLVCWQCALAQPGSATYLTRKTAEGKALKYYKKGMEYSRKGDNQNAIKEFEKALKQDDRFIDAQLQWAASYYDMQQMEQAEIGFEKVLAIDPAYNPKVYYTLGLVEKRLRKFDEASSHFIKYIDSNPKNEILLKKARKHQLDSEFMAKAFDNPVPFQPENLGNLINTEGWEYLPCLTADQERLLYTAIRDGQEDFFISEKKEGVWQAGKPLSDINTPKNEGAQTISADGSLLVYTACNRKESYGQCDLFFSEVKDGRWTKTANMGSTINSKYSEKQPSLSADGRTLYFSSDRPGGHGNHDLWVSRRGQDNKWSKPANLGPVVNTSEHEGMPFIHADGQTLYFVSEGHPGLGNFDLFVARMDSAEWQKPQNLGYPINSTGNDATLIVSLDGKTAYFASDRDSSGRDPKGRYTTDLFQFELYPEARPKKVTYVKGQVSDFVTKKPLEASVKIFDLASGREVSNILTSKDGQFLVTLPLGKDYMLHSSKSKYLFHSENFALARQVEIDRPYELDIELQPIPLDTTADVPEEGRPVVLNNVFFDTGSSDLKKQSFVELDQLATLLTDYDHLKIRINGHTDDVGSETDNLNLSEMRAKAVRQYLIEKGIRENRLSFKGFGETQPIASNENEEGRRQNRRTEFEVLNK